MISVRKHVIVAASPQRAFRAFTEGMNRWWPHTHPMLGGAVIDRVVVEPFTGGRWYATGPHGSEYDLGRVLDWQPPHRLVLSWQLSARGQYQAALVTEIEVHVLGEDARRTRVELEHRHFERHGDAAEKLESTFASGWQVALDAFAAASVAPKFLMIYETTPAGLAKAQALLAAHIDRLDLFQRRGTLLMAGPVMDGSGRAYGVFTSREAADDFMAGDPFMTGGVVERSSVIEWREALF